ncbi:MAG TPA: bacillithiol biosynthesis BshC [Thermoanaerobaculia bacterium]|nr:bacillithiol biosynthesis BshC [Thermoanaerobaculia bacterium]
MSRLSFTLPLAAYPGMAPFVLDWLSGRERATRFLPRATSADLRAVRPAQATAPLVSALIQLNRQWGIDVEDEVRGWAAGERVALIAGQQVGFGGGPLYTLAKIATLLKMKKQLEQEGRRSIVFFWLATEDHDFDEIAQLTLSRALLPRSSFGPERLDLLTIRGRARRDPRAPVGPLEIPEDLIAELLAAERAAERPPWLRRGITFRDSFAELIAAAVREKIVLIDALLPELREAGATLFERVVDRFDAIDQRMRQTAQDLEQAGYVPQIEAREDGRYTLLYRMVDGERRLMTGPEGIGSPSNISTSAITRPLLQDFLFAPAVFVGGPAEVSYCAQIRPLYRLLDVQPSAVALRGHALVAPRRTARLFERFQIAPGQAFSDPDVIAAEGQDDGAQAIRRIAASAREQLSDSLTRIGEIALPAEHSLARSITRSIGHIEYHFNKLTERSLLALARQDRGRYDAAQEIAATFYPARTVQDRVVGWLPFWCRYGERLIERLVEEIEPDSSVFKIVGL